MRVKVIGKNSSGAFMAVDPVEDSYYIFTLDDLKDIELGDLLEGDFDETGGLWKEIYNATREDCFQISVENWACTRGFAFERLQELGTPAEVWLMATA